MPVSACVCEVTPPIIIEGTPSFVAFAPSFKPIGPLYNIFDSLKIGAPVDSLKPPPLPLGPIGPCKSTVVITQVVPLYSQTWPLNCK